MPAALVGDHTLQSHPKLALLLHPANKIGSLLLRRVIHRFLSDHKTTLD
jgi:hypothetical protein